MSIAIPVENTVKTSQSFFQPLSKEQIFAELQKSEDDIRNGRVYKAETVIKEIRHRLYS